MDIKSNKLFRVNGAIIRIVLDEGVDTSKEALRALAMMLKLSSKAYKDERGLLLRLMDLYSSNVYFSEASCYGRLGFEVSFACPVDKYVGVTFPSLQGRIIDTCKKILDGGFEHDEASLMLVKGKLLRDNLDIEGDSVNVAKRNFVKTFTPDLSSAFSGNGDEARIKSLTFDDLEKALAIVKKSKAYVGCVGFEKYGRDIGGMFPLSDEPFTKKKKVEIVQRGKDLTLEKSNITTSAVVVGYETKPLEEDKYLPGISMIESLLTNDTSALFQNLREKKGLTYGVDVDLITRANLMMIQVSTEPKNVQAVLQTIDDTISNIEQTIDEAKLEEIKEEKRIAMERTFGNPISMARLSVSSLMHGVEPTKECVLSLIESLTLDDVKDLFRSFKRIGSFTVNPKEGE